MAEAAQQQPWGYWANSFDDPPALCCSAWETYAARACANSNFLKGVQWAPDGSCCLTASDDNCLRVFDLPQDALEPEGAPRQPGGSHADDDGAAAAACDAWQPAVQVHAGETVYDYAWFSGMAASDPASCCFASTSRGQPIRLWDAVGGGLRASYRGYDDADEVTAAFSLAFSPDGGRLLAGYGRCLRLFDVARPGRDCSRIPTHKKKQEGSIPGIISCLAFNALEQDLFAAGSYSRCMGLFDARTHEQLLWLEGHAGGVTQVTFSPDGNYLYSGARRDGSIHCWDIRATGQVVYSLRRPTSGTNQRIGFSIEPCGRHLVTGGCDGFVRAFDLTDGRQVGQFRAAQDTVNGAAFSPCLPLLATASGHRRFPLLHGDDDDDDADSSSSGEGGGEEQQEEEGGRRDPLRHLLMSSCRPGGGCNSLRLWRLRGHWVEAAAQAAAEGADGGEAAQDTAAAMDAS